MSVEKLAKAREKKQKQNGGSRPWLVTTERGIIKFLPGVLARHLAETVHAFYAGETFFIYKSGVYAEREDTEAAGIVKTYLPDVDCRSARITDALNLWKLDILKSADALNPDPLLVNLKNGLLDVQTGAFEKHDPVVMSVIQLNCDYDAAAECPLFLKFLDEVLPPENILLIQEFFGYCLIPVTIAQKAFILHGPGQSGKSTVLSVLEKLLGERNVSNIEWQDLGDRFKTANLFNKLANIAADLPARAIEDAAMFKAIVGEDTITAERKFKNPFSFKPFARLLFSCNKLPYSRDQSDGFYRRPIIIPFARVVASGSVDKNLKAKLYEEINGIFVWALAGLRRLMENDFTFSENESTRAQMESYKRENSNVLAYVAENCTISPACHIRRELLYQDYKRFCEQNGFKFASQRNFNREIELNFSSVSRGFYGPETTREKVWRGIGLTVDGWDKNPEMPENTGESGVLENTEIF